MIALGAAAVAVAVLLLALFRLLLGPTLYDRVIAANACTLLAAVAAAAISVWLRDPRGVDAAIALMAAVLVGNVAMYKYFYARTFQSAIASAGEEP